MKFDINKPVNLDLLREQFTAEFGNFAVVGASTIEVPDEHGDRAREMLDEHKVSHTTKQQRVMREYQSEVDTAEVILSFGPDLDYKDFVERLSDVETMGEFLWVVWLKLNPPKF